MAGRTAAIIGGGLVIGLAAAIVYAASITPSQTPLRVEPLSMPQPISTTPPRPSQTPSPQPPPANSGVSLHVKFRDGLVVDDPMTLLPTALQRDVVWIAPLFTLPPGTLDALRVTGEANSGAPLPDLTLWFVIQLRPETDVESFLAALLALDTVETATIAPAAAPPPG